jgi:hypothetical protein
MNGVDRALLTVYRRSLPSLEMNAPKFGLKNPRLPKAPPALSFMLPMLQNVGLFPILVALASYHSNLSMTFLVISSASLPGNPAACVSETH